MTDELLYAVEGGVATLTLNRPEKKNAFTAAMIDDWSTCLLEAQQDAQVHAIVVTGAGDAFCAGADLNVLGRPTALDHKRFLWEQVHRVPLALERIDKPVIAMIPGVAAGAGLDMALMCDLRFASDRARLGETYVKVGLVPGDGGAYYLPRLVGLDRALELLWTGDFVDASEALRMGMVTRVFAHDELKAKTYAFAQRIVDGPPLAIRMTKRAAYQSQRTDLATALDLISSHVALALQSQDHQEGLRAFRDGDKPKFVGR